MRRGMFSWRPIRKEGIPYTPPRKPYPKAVKLPESLDLKLARYKSLLTAIAKTLEMVEWLKRRWERAIDPNIKEFYKQEYLRQLEEFGQKWGNAITETNSLAKEDKTGTVVVILEGMKEGLRRSNAVELLQYASTSQQ